MLLMHRLLTLLLQLLNILLCGGSRIPLCMHLYLVSSSALLIICLSTHIKTKLAVQLRAICRSRGRSSLVCLMCLALPAGSPQKKGRCMRCAGEVTVYLRSTYSFLAITRKFRFPMPLPFLLLLELILLVVFDFFCSLWMIWHIT